MKPAVNAPPEIVETGRWGALGQEVTNKTPCLMRGRVERYRHQDSHVRAARGFGGQPVLPGEWRREGDTYAEVAPRLIEPYLYPAAGVVSAQLGTPPVGISATVPCAV